MSDEFATVSARTPADWTQWLRQNVEIDNDGVGLQTTTVLQSTELGVEATDIDLHPNGNVSMLTPSGEIAVYVRTQGERKSLSLAGYADAGFKEPSLVGTSGSEIYVIDASQGRVGAFSRRLRQLKWTSGGFVDPIAAVGSQRRGYVLDRGSGSDAGFVRTVAPGGETAVVLDGLTSPLDLSVAGEETLFVLDERPDGPVLLRSQSTAGRFDEATVVPLELPGEFIPQKIAAHTLSTLVFYGVSDDTPQLVQYDLTTQTVESTDTLEQSWAQLLSGTVGSTGDPDELLLRSHWNQVSLLDKTTVNQKDPETTRYEGRIRGRFDAGVRDVEWHRMTLAIGNRDPGTRIDVLYYATNGDTAGVDDFQSISNLDERRITELRAADITGLWDLINHTPTEIAGVLPETPIEEIEAWFDQAGEVLEQTFHQRSDVQQEFDPTDMLLDECEGRYLHVEVRLVGRRHSSLELEALTAYCPRRSYTRYLPEIYREQDRKSPFLSEFLSIFESVFVDIEETMDGRTQYLDPQEIPSEYLSWLDEWLAVEISENWPEPARRELLERLPDLYKMRGTKRGILTLVELYLSHLDLEDPPWNPEIHSLERRLDSLVADGYLTDAEAETQVDHYRNTNLGQPADTMLFFEHEQLDDSGTEQTQYYSSLVGHPRRFQLLLSPSVSDDHVQAIESIVEAEKPVYTDTNVDRLQRRFLLEGHTYLGINTILQKDTFEIGMSKLGQETRIKPDRRAERQLDREDEEE